MFGHHGQSNRKNDAEDNYLQYLPFSNGLGDVLGKDLYDEVAGNLLLSSHSLRCHGWSHTYAGLGNVDSSQTDQQRKRSYDFEIDQCLHAHASNLFQVGVPGNSHDQSRKNQRSNDGLDQAEKNRAQKLQLSGASRPVSADLRAEQDASRDPGSE